MQSEEEDAAEGVVVAALPDAEELMDQDMNSIQDLNSMKLHNVADSNCFQC